MVGGTRAKDSRRQFALLVTRDGFTRVITVSDTVHMDVIRMPVYQELTAVEGDVINPRIPLDPHQSYREYERTRFNIQHQCIEYHEIDVVGRLSAALLSQEKVIANMRARIRNAHHELADVVEGRDF